MSQGAKDEIKRPEWPSARSRGLEGPLSSSALYVFLSLRPNLVVRYIVCTVALFAKRVKPYHFDGIKY